LIAKDAIQDGMMLFLFLNIEKEIPVSDPHTSSEFLSVVRKSGVLDEKRFKERYPDESGLPESPSECAALLVKEGFLTQYQAKQLLLGKFKGFRLGTYKILQPLGQGGMGMVFLGEHLSLKRKVAIKVLRAEKTQDQLGFERFQREARAAAALNHPNIMGLHDIGQQGGVHFLVMEYVEGTDLQSFGSKSGALNYVQAVQYIAQAAAGLQHAHEKGFVHRDIKPSNLMLTKEGTIKILDMGLARSFVNEDDNLTGRLGDEAEIAVTVDYASPEQALGMRIDERSDVYSLGVTLFHLITGHPPYRGTSTQKIAQHQLAEPPRLRRIKPIVPEPLSEVVAKMMAKKPSDRYQSMNEVLDALAPWLPVPTTGNIACSWETQRNLEATRPTKKRSSPSEETSGKAKKNYLILGGIAGGIILVVGLLIVLFKEGKSPSTDKKPLDSTTKQSKEPSNSPRRPRTESIFTPISFKEVATNCSLKNMFMNIQEDARGRLLFESWGRIEVDQIPFDLIDPEEGDVNNIIQLFSPNSDITRTMPRSVLIPIRSSAEGIHFLGGVSGWGWPLTGPGSSPRGSRSVIVKLKYIDGMIEEHELRNGEHFADYITRHDVPGSKFALMTSNNHQIRYLSIEPKRPNVMIDEMTLLKGEDITAPVFLAITVENPKDTKKN
jgi:serine/threonine protein kinase